MTRLLCWLFGHKPTVRGLKVGVLGILNVWVPMCPRCRREVWR